MRCCWGCLCALAGVVWSVLILFVWLGFVRVFEGSKNGVQKAGKMVLGYGRSAKLNFRAYRNPFRF